MADREPPFYVGYLKLPAGLKGFLIAALAVLLVVDGGLAVIAFAGQPPHATGDWGQGDAVTYRGQFQAKPYPLVRLFPSGGKPGGAVLLAGEGKDGPPLGMDGLDGAMVETQGYPVTRGDLIVLQIDQPPVRQDASRMDPLPQGPAEPATLTGEVVDSKCYAGAMNPGEGKAHEACGSFCLYGGIPALFVANDPDGNVRWYLMAAPDGGPVGDEARALVGRSVRLTGTIRRGDGLATFTVAADQLVAP